MAATAGCASTRCVNSAYRRGRGAAGLARGTRRAAVLPTRSTRAVVAPNAAMASSPSTPVPMKVMGSNIKLTDSIREHAEEKVGNAVRNYNAMVSHVDINLSVKTKGRGQKGADEHKAEVTVYTRRHGLIRAEERSANDGSVYESIDMVSDKLARKLRRTKEKTNNRVRHGRAVHRQDRDEKLEELMEEEIEIEIESKHAERIERAQNTDSVVIRVKQFEMPPMTVSDAVEAVENIDHDWYVFCNSETGKINVLYARNAGGYGLVVPLMDGEEDDAVIDGKTPK